MSRHDFSSDAYTRASLCCVTDAAESDDRQKLDKSATINVQVLRVLREAFACETRSGR